MNLFRNGHISTQQNFTGQQSKPNRVQPKIVNVLDSFKEGKINNLRYKISNVLE